MHDGVELSQSDLDTVLPFDDVEAFLDDPGYGLVVIDAAEAFAIVVKQYTDHPANILNQTVSKRSVDG